MKETAPWSLGRFGPFLNAVALAWIAFIAVVFSLPPNELVLWTMLLFAVLLAARWFGGARQTFVGPSAGGA